LEKQEEIFDLFESNYLGGVPACCDDGCLPDNGALLLGVYEWEVL